MWLRTQFALLFLYVCAISGAAQAGTFDYEALIDLIQTKKPQSIAELLPLLPENYRSNYLRIYKSKSQQDASPENPRIVLYGEDANLLIAFNGSSSQKGFDKLEVTQFRQKTKQFEYRELTLPLNANSLPEKNPQSCLQCHGTPPRPNWEGYFLWPGVMGSHDCDSIGTETVYESYFASAILKNPRYRSLKPMKTCATTQFTSLIAKLNFSRIAATILNDPVLSDFRYAIAGSLICSDGQFPVIDFMPESMRLKFESSFERKLNDTKIRNRSDFLDRYRETESLIGSLPDDSRASRRYEKEDGDHIQSTLEDATPTATLRYWVEGLGRSIKGWSMSFRSDALAFNDGRLGLKSPNIWVELFQNAQDLSTREQIQNSTTAIVSYLESLDSNHPQPPPKEYAQTCSSLKIKSLAHLNAALKNKESPLCHWAETKPTAPKEIEALRQKIQPSRSSGSDLSTPALRLCVNCHTGSAPLAPAIPFNRPGELKALSGNILDRISEKPKSGKQMPPNRPLTAVEREEIKNFLNGNHE